MMLNRIMMIFYLLLFSASNILSQVHGNSDRGSVDKMRDIELQLLSRNQIHSFALESVFSVIETDESFLKNHDYYTPARSTEMTLLHTDIGYRNIKLNLQV